MVNQSMTKNSSDRIGGFIVVTMGVWFLLHNFGVNVPNLGDFWPIFPIIGGATAINAYFTSGRRAPEALLPGTIAMLTGGFFFLFTMGIIPWASMEVLWPAFPTIVGLAFMLAWHAGGPSTFAISGLFTLLFGGVSLGLVFLGVNVDMGDLWPIFMILGGLGLFTPRFWHHSRN